MKTFKSKKSKVIATCMAVVATVCILCVTLAGCKSPLIGDTALGVYFVGDFQDNIDDATLQSITRDGANIISIESAFEQANIDPNTDLAKAAAAIYAVAVTNYNNVTQSGFYILTNANVIAKNVSALAGNDANVDIRSTYSSFTGKKGSFSQTVSGVTKLQGLGNLGDMLKKNFGYNIQSFSNSSFSANRRGPNGGAQFPPVDNEEGIDVYKYILGAFNDGLTETTKGGNVSITPASEQNTDKPIPEYEPAAGAKYPEDSTLAGVNLPDFNKNRKAWEPLNRVPSRYWDGDTLIEDGAVVEGTRYSYGTYGAGFAVYDFSRPNYLSDDTKVSYNKDLDLWTVEIKVKDEFVNQACEFAAGDLIRDTQGYIGLKNAKYTEISCRFEVYGNGLIKSMQKRDVLKSDEKCPLKAIPLPATCNGGGVTSNTATLAFSYSDNDTNAERLAALYWPELGQDKIFNDKKVSTALKLDLSGYVNFDNYEPVVNEALRDQFTDIFATK